MPLTSRKFDEEYHFKANDQQDRNKLLRKTTGPVGLDHTRKPAKNKKIALIGWGIPSIEALQNLERSFIVVSFPEFQDYAEKHDIPFLSWNFGKDQSYNEIYEQSKELYRLLKELDVDQAIPIFEETVEWAGALNARFRDDPKVFEHSILFRDKALMKRRAHMGGLRVGVFEEAKSKEDVREFFYKVNSALLRQTHDNPDPVHVKALNKAGATGHRIIMSNEDIDWKIDDDHFPSLIESHLHGLEVSCEAFIHKGKVRFLNITEYVVFGHSMMVPPTKEVEKHRTQIRKEVQKLVDVFDINCGFIHPEFFITDEEELYFGEVAFRIPGGHIFELMQKTYGFNPYEAHILCCDPNTSDDELKNLFPEETTYHGHAGSLLVYPKTNQINDIHIPEEIEDNESFDKHTLFRPALGKIESNQEGYGNNLGTIFFHGDEEKEVKRLLSDYVDHNFYI